MSYKFTVADLLEHLSGIDPQTEVLFGPRFAEGKELTFFRTKRRGLALLQIEFGERLEWAGDGLVLVREE